MLIYLLPVWCRYYEEKGFSVILAARTLNVLALGFTVVFSGFLLLSVKWSALHSECVVAGTCDIAEVCTCWQCRVHHFTDFACLLKLQGHVRRMALDKHIVQGIASLDRCLPDTILVFIICPLDPSKRADLVVIQCDPLCNCYMCTRNTEQQQQSSIQ